MSDSANATTADIICFSSSDWDGKWGSRQQVMLRLATRGHRVLFVEQLAGLEHFWKYADLRKRRYQGWQEGLREIKPNLRLVSPPPLLPGRYYLTAIASVNAAIVQRWLKPYLRQLSFDAPILWLYKPEQAPLIGKFNETMTVYHCIDEFTVGTAGRKRQTIQTLETNLLKRADIVFANSQLTFQNKQKFNPNTYHLPSGADIAHFTKAANPATNIHPDIRKLPRPILAFVGNINEKIDIPMLTSVAHTHPEWTLVMIGQPHPYAIDLQPLQHISNVHWLGKQPFSALPEILKGVDICLLPYAQGEATRYRSPLKLYEYLATGKPIVSTPHPEVTQFSNLITISPAETFDQAIESALKTDTPQARAKRIQAAQQHSWDARVDEILAILSQHSNLGGIYTITTGK